MARTIIEFSTKIDIYGRRTGVEWTLAEPVAVTFRVVLDFDQPVTQSEEAATAWEQVDGPMGVAWALINSGMCHSPGFVRAAHLPEEAVFAMAMLRMAGMADLGRETRDGVRFVDLGGLPTPSIALPKTED